MLPEQSPLVCCSVSGVEVRKRRQPEFRPRKCEELANRGMSVKYLQLAGGRYFSGLYRFVSYYYVRGTRNAKQANTSNCKFDNGGC